MDGRFALPVDTVVDGGYRIERVVGSGGFGITYVAEDIKLGTRVALKEYYPEEFGERDRTMSVRPKSERHKKTFNWGRANFLQEARTLARFEHPSIVRITRVFEANATAYMVMRFEEGKSFETWLQELGRAPTQAELDRIARALLDALEMMHAESFLHRDIAPDNIVVREDGSPVLLDFGAARRAVAEMSRSLTGIVKAGYSPHEQYSSDGRLQGPWSDIYALGGTLYRAVTGRLPEEATLRVDVDGMPPVVKAAKGDYRPEFLAAIDRCLRVRHAERPQSVAELRTLLLGIAPDLAKQPERSRQQPALVRATRLIVPKKGGVSRRVIAMAALVVLLGGAYGIAEYTRLPLIWSGAPETEGKELATLIEKRRKEAADAAQRQVEQEIEQKRREALAAAQRQAELDVQRRREEEMAEAARQAAAAEAERQREAAATETARKQVELEAERVRKEAAQREADIAAERQRREAAEAALREAAERQRVEAEREAADLAARQRQETLRKAEAERAANAAAVKEAADADLATRARLEAEIENRNEDERRRLSAQPDAEKRAEFIRKIQQVLKRSRCYLGALDGRSGSSQEALDKFTENVNRRGRLLPLRIELAKASVGGFEGWLRDAGALGVAFCTPPKVKGNKGINKQTPVAARRNTESPRETRRRGEVKSAGASENARPGRRWEKKVMNRFGGGGGGMGRNRYLLKDPTP